MQAVCQSDLVPLCRISNGTIRELTHQWSQHLKINALDRKRITQRGIWQQKAWVVFLNKARVCFRMSQCVLAMRHRKLTLAYLTTLPSGQLYLCLSDLLLGSQKSLVLPLWQKRQFCCFWYILMYFNIIDFLFFKYGSAEESRMPHKGRDCVNHEIRIFTVSLQWLFFLESKRIRKTSFQKPECTTQLESYIIRIR